MIPNILSVLGGYLIGSIPTAYLVVRRNSRLDLTKAGSGNVGALNAGKVTGSKSLGILVGVIDGIKGAAAVLVTGAVTEGFLPPALALLGAVIGHNYPVWLRFKGGRGLATACGGLFGIGLGYTVLWCTTWAVLKFSGRSVLAANLISTLVAPIALFLIPGSVVSFAMTSSGDPTSFRWFCASLSGLLLLSHLDAIKEVVSGKQRTMSGEQ